MQGNDDTELCEEIDNIFEVFEKVINNHYNEFPQLEITTFQEELEVKKYIRDNPITPEEVTRIQLKSIKGNLL